MTTYGGTSTMYVSLGYTCVFRGSLRQTEQPVLEGEAPSGAQSLQDQAEEVGPRRAQLAQTLQVHLRRKAEEEKGQEDTAPSTRHGQ